MHASPGPGSSRARHRKNPATAAPATQRGAVAIMFAASLIVIMAVFGMALDLTRLYNRKAELQNVADAAALAAAHELDGTAAGLANAMARAKSSAELLKYQYNNEGVAWTDAALRFGDAATTSNWVDLGDAQNNPALWRFVKVDTSALDAAYSVVDLFFIRVVAPALNQASMQARAVAGRTATNIAPLAICAMSTSAAQSRTWAGPPQVNELVEYGFRRGVAYDLMKLNPAGSAAENFVVDPFAVPGGPAGTTATNMSDDVISPFICTGTMALGQVLKATVMVRRPFPINTFYRQLNSRFDQFAAKTSGAYCDPDIAPPDANIKEYGYKSIGWMSAVPEGQTARSTTDGGQLRTVADLVPPASAANTAAMYGPLWSFARAVPFASYQVGVPEPVAGYATFGPANWTSLYKPGQPVAKSNYPATTPYAMSSGDTYSPPTGTRKGVRGRRILNIPLLECPLPVTTPAPATVLAIGRFLMTVPASSSQLSAEFGGIVSQQTIGGNVELYP